MLALDPAQRVVLVLTGSLLKRTQIGLESRIGLPESNALPVPDRDQVPDLPALVQQRFGLVGGARQASDGMLKSNLVGNLFNRWFGHDFEIKACDWVWRAALRAGLLTCDFG